MSSLMLINPKARSKARPARSAKQKAATKKMLAANRARRGPHNARYAARKATNTVPGYFPNPVKRRKARAVGLARVSAVSKRRRNPTAALRSSGGLMGMGMTAVQGAGGALLVNTALNYMPFLPAVLKTGNGKYLARVGVAIAIGAFGNKLLPGKVAANMAVGAMTVAFHDLMLGLGSQAMPGLKLGDVGDYDDGVSAYLADEQSVGELQYMDGMGEVQYMNGVGADVYSETGSY